MAGRIIDLPLELNHFWIWVIAISSLKLSWTAFSTSFVFLKEWLNIIKSRLRALSPNPCTQTVGSFDFFGWFFFFKRTAEFDVGFFFPWNNSYCFKPRIPPHASIKTHFSIFVCKRIRKKKQTKKSKLCSPRGEAAIQRELLFVLSMALLFPAHCSSCRRYGRCYRAWKRSSRMQQQATAPLCWTHPARI